MAEGRIKNTELSAIAAAIRSKNGESTVYKPGEMAQAILDIPSGGSAVIESKNITENGTYTAPTGVDGYNPVTVAVQPNLQSKTATENGTVTPDTGYDGLSSVVVNVSGGGTGVVSVPLNIRTQAFISSINIVSWDNTSWPSYQQFWLDLAPFAGRSITINNTGDRNFYGFTSSEPQDGMQLNNPRADSGGALTVQYTGGSNRYLVYDFSTVVAGGMVTVAIS